MTTTKLASAALIGLMTTSLLAASPVFAGEQEKGSCKSKSGCKNKAAAEKSECKAKAESEKASCTGKEEKK